MIKSYNEGKQSPNGTICKNGAHNHLIKHNNTLCSNFVPIMFASHNFYVSKLSHSVVQLTHQGQLSLTDFFKFVTQRLENF